MFDDYNYESQMEKDDGRVKCANCLQWMKHEETLVVDQKLLIIWCLECIDKEDC